MCLQSIGVTHRLVAQWAKKSDYSCKISQEDNVCIYPAHLHGFRFHLPMVRCLITTRLVPAHFGTYAKPQGGFIPLLNPGSAPQASVVSAHSTRCTKITLWIDDAMVYPDVDIGEMPNPDMPEDVAEVYLEARSIAARSQRGTAALLRLAVQMLCKHLGGKGVNVNDDLATLIARGLPVQVQQALD
jgi:hypothetical protein